jgi:hypothetical protein
VPTTLARPGRARPCSMLVFVNGVTAQGRRHPDVQRLLRALARGGLPRARPGPHRPRAGRDHGEYGGRCRRRRLRSRDRPGSTRASSSSACCWVRRCASSVAMARRRGVTAAGRGFELPARSSNRRAGVQVTSGTGSAGSRSSRWGTLSPFPVECRRRTRGSRGRRFRACPAWRGAPRSGSSSWPCSSASCTG